MKEFVTSSALTRLLANVFIFLCLIVCLFIGAWEIIATQPINPICYTVVSTGMAYALMLLGVHAGAQLPTSGPPLVPLEGAPLEVTVKRPAVIQRSENAS